MPDVRFKPDVSQPFIKLQLFCKKKWAKPLKGDRKRDAEEKPAQIFKNMNEHIPQEQQANVQVRME